MNYYKSKLTCDILVSVCSKFWTCFESCRVLGVWLLRVIAGLRSPGRSLLLSRPFFEVSIAFLGGYVISAVSHFIFFTLVIRSSLRCVFFSELNVSFIQFLFNKSFCIFDLRKVYFFVFNEKWRNLPTFIFIIELSSHSDFLEFSVSKHIFHDSF